MPPLWEDSEGWELLLPMRRQAAAGVLAVSVPQQRLL